MTLTDVDKNDEGWYHCKTHDFRGEVFTSFFSIKTRGMSYNVVNNNYICHIINYNN